MDERRYRTLLALDYELLRQAAAEHDVYEACQALRSLATHLRAADLLKVLSSTMVVAARFFADRLPSLTWCVDVANDLPNMRTGVQWRQALDRVIAALGKGRRGPALKCFLGGLAMAIDGTSDPCGEGAGLLCSAFASAGQSVELLCRRRACARAQLREKRTRERVKRKADLSAPVVATRLDRDLLFRPVAKVLEGAWTALLAISEAARKEHKRQRNHKARLLHSDGRLIMGIQEQLRCKLARCKERSARLVRWDDGAGLRALWLLQCHLPQEQAVELVLIVAESALRSWGQSSSLTRWMASVLQWGKAGHRKEAKERMEWCMKKAQALRNTSAALFSTIKIVLGQVDRARTGAPDAEGLAWALEELFGTPSSELARLSRQTRMLLQSQLQLVRAQDRGQDFRKRLHRLGRAALLEKTARLRQILVMLDSVLAWLQSRPVAVPGTA